MPESPVMATKVDGNLPCHARRQCLESARAMADLFHRYFHDFGSRNIGIWMFQTVTVVAYMLLEDLGDPETQDIFHEICLAITHVSRRMFVMRGHVRMLLITADQRGQTIPEKTRQRLTHIAIDTWGPEDHKLFDACIFPNYTLAKGGDPRTAAMGDLLEQWSNLTLRRSRTRTPTPDTDGRRRNSPPRKMSSFGTSRSASTGRN